MILSFLLVINGFLCESWPDLNLAEEGDTKKEETVFYSDEVDWKTYSSSRCGLTADDYQSRPNATCSYNDGVSKLKCFYERNPDKYSSCADDVDDWRKRLKKMQRIWSGI